MASVRKLPLVGQTHGPEDNTLIAASIVVDRTGSQDRASDLSLDLKDAASITTASRAGVRRGGRTSTGAVKSMPSTLTTGKAGAKGVSHASTGAVKNTPSTIAASEAGARGVSHASTGAVKSMPSTLTTGKAGAKGGSLNSTGAVKNTPSTIAAGKAGAKGLGLNLAARNVAAATVISIMDATMTGKKRVLVPSQVLKDADFITMAGQNRVSVPSHSLEDRKVAAVKEDSINAIVARVAQVAAHRVT